MDFEWYDPNTAPLKVSIGNYGITFYNDTIKAMGAPECIRLGFNAENKIIGAKVCENESDTGIRFISKMHQSYVRINDKNFIRFIDSKVDQNLSKTGSPKKYGAYWNENEKTLYIFLEKTIE